MFTFSVQESTTIDRPIEEVFNYIADCRNDIEWCPSVKAIRQVAGSGPGPGARYEMHHEPGGMSFDAEVEVIEFEQPHRLSWVMTDAGHTIHGTYKLEPTSTGGTRLTQTSKVTFERWLRIPGLFLKGVIAKDVRKELNKQFARLQERLESQHAPEQAA